MTHEGQQLANMQKSTELARLRDEIEEATTKLGELETQAQAIQEQTERRHAELVDSIVELRQRLGAIL